MDTKKDVMFLENTSKPRVLKWLFASVLLCALLVCAWTVAAGAEESPHEHDYVLYVDWSEDTTQEPTVTNARLVCWLQDCTDTVYIPDEDVTVLDSGFESYATCTQPEMWHYMAQVDFEGWTYHTTSENVYPKGDPLGHNYTVSPEDFIISRNEQTATATAVCWRCNEYTEGHTMTVEAIVTGKEKVAEAADCQTPSWWEYTLSCELYDDDIITYAYGSDYGDHWYVVQTDDFTLSENEKTATAKAVCDRCGNTTTVTATVEEKDEAIHGDCQTPFQWAYHIYYELNGGPAHDWIYVDGDYGDHWYSITADGFTLSENGETATTTAVCDIDGCTAQTAGHTKTITVNVTDSAEETPGDCMNRSCWTYYLSYKLNGEPHEGDPLQVWGDYGDHWYAITEDGFTLSGDGKTATTTVVCSYCDEKTAGHTTTVTATVRDFEELTAGDCETPSYWQYSLFYMLNGEPYESDTLQVWGDYGDHRFTTRPSTQLAHDATCTKAAEYYVQCDLCEAVSETKTVEVGDPQGHSYQLTTGFTLSANGESATATAACERCNGDTAGHTTTVTATVTGSDKVDEGDCQNRSVWEYTLSYELNGDSDCKDWILADGDYGDHFFTEIATQGRQAIRGCSICGKLEGIEALSAVSAQLTGTKPAPASRVMVRYGTLVSGEKVIAIALVDSNGNTVTTNAVCEVSISLAELNALLGEDAGDAFAHTLYPHKGGAKERIPMQYAIENGRLLLNVSFKTSGLYVLTID